jgi:hypothetical protein
LGSDDYDSAACRAANVEYITGVFFTNRYLAEVIDGTDRESLDGLQKGADEYLAKPLPEVDEDYARDCGRFSTASLVQAYKEIHTLAPRVFRDADILVEKPGIDDPDDPRASTAAVALSEPEALDLTEDLFRMTGEFRWLGAFSGRLGSIVLRRIGFVEGQKAKSLTRKETYGFKPLRGV